MIKTCAVILEPLQGEGGIHPATREFYGGRGPRFCDENDMLMICDEIPCGMGRTGQCSLAGMTGVRPDVLTMAKAIGTGSRGGRCHTEKVAESSLKAGRPRHRLTVTTPSPAWP